MASLNQLQAEREREAFLAQRAQEALQQAAAAERDRDAEEAAAAQHAADLARRREVCRPPGSIFSFVNSTVVSSHEPGFAGYAQIFAYIP